MLLAAALNPAVEAIERRGLARPWAASLVFVTALGRHGDRIPDHPAARRAGDRLRQRGPRLHRRSHGRGRPLGWLQDEYQIVDRIRAAIEEQGVGGILGLGGPVLDVVRSVVTAIVGVITIVFLTYFMLLEGPRTIAGILGLLPESARPRYERVGRDVYRAISGYVTGNLLISLVAGTLSTIVLFAVGSEFAVALGLLVAVLDLIPLAGATLAAILVSTVIFIETDWLRCVIVIVFFVAYQQFENHVLQPLVYGRTVQLSPLAVLCAVLIGRSSPASSARSSRSRSRGRSSRSFARSCSTVATRPPRPENVLDPSESVGGFALRSQREHIVALEPIEAGGEMPTWLLVLIVVLLVLAVFGGFGYSRR